MTGDQVGPKLSAALQAQASGQGTGSPATPAAVAPNRGRARAMARMPGWVILLLAVALGSMAGGLAGVLSTW